MRMPPQFLYVHVNKRCNLRCQHCDFWKQDDNDKHNYLSWERRRDILAEFAELNPQGKVVICGGEKLLDLEDYFLITMECRALGLRALGVTNGTRIYDERIAERLICEGAHEITVSLDSHMEILHDEMRGVKGAFRKAVNAIRLLLAARQRLNAIDTRIYVMGLIFSRNYQDLDDFYNFVLNDIKADKLKLNFIQPTFGHQGETDDFFARHHHVDPDRLAEIIMKCDRKYKLELNPVWLDHVRMYFRSLNNSRDVQRGWGARTGTEEHICNSYERNIMVDHYGVAGLCFSTSFPGKRLQKKGDLRAFWEGSDALRNRMRQCNRYCGISHSVRRETSTLASRRPLLEPSGTRRGAFYNGSAPTI